MKLSLKILLAFSILVGVSTLSYANLPAELEARLILRAIKFEENLSNKEKGISIYILSQPSLFDALKEHEGERIGHSKLVSVQGGDVLPLEPIDILFVGSAMNSNIDDVMAYSQRNSILTITDKSEWLFKEISLLLSVYAGKPEYIINISGSNVVGAKWHKTFLSNARIVD